MFSLRSFHSNRRVNSARDGLVNVCNRRDRSCDWARVRYVVRHHRNSCSSNARWISVDAMSTGLTMAERLTVGALIRANRRNLVDSHCDQEEQVMDNEKATNPVVAVLMTASDVCRSPTETFDRYRCQKGDYLLTQTRPKYSP